MPTKLDKPLEKLLNEVDQCIVRIITAKLLSRNNGDPRAIAAQVRNDPSKLLQAVENDKTSGMDILNYRFTAQALREIRKILEAIRQKQVQILTMKRTGQSTASIYEDNLGGAIDGIDGTYGVLPCTAEIISNTTNPPSDTSLGLLEDVRNRARRILRQLKRMQKPALRWTKLSRIALILIIIGLLAIPIFYARRASVSSGSASIPQAVKTQISADKAAVQKALNEPGKSDVGRSISALETVAKAMSLIPTLLIGLAFLFAALQYLLIDQGWRGKGFGGISRDLSAAAKRTKDELGKGTAA